MGIKNEEVTKLIHSKFKSMEDHLNIMETELVKENDEDFNRSKVSMSHGKIQKIYEDITWLLGVFDSNPKF